MTVAEVLRQGSATLDRAGSDAPALEAKWLLRRALDRPSDWVLGHLADEVGADSAKVFTEAVERRLAGEPLSYILTESEFYGRLFFVDRRVLVPRPETELLVEQVLTFAATRRAIELPARHIVDVGTGSGILAVTLALELDGVVVVASDISADALAVAAINRARHRVDDSVSLTQSDLFDCWRTTALEASPLFPADVIVANLPYVSTGQIDFLQPEVRREPRGALDGGPDGLDLYRRFFCQAPRFLAPRGGVFAEIGDNQGPTVARLASEAFPGCAVDVLPDLAGRDRIVAVTPRRALE